MKPDHLDRIYLFEDYFGNSIYTWNIEFTYFPSQIESEPTIIFGESRHSLFNTTKPFRYGDEFTLSTTIQVLTNQ